MENKSLEGVLTDELKDIYNAENQILKALPRMAEKASNLSLKQAFEEHLIQTEGHVKRLDQIGQLLQTKLTGKKCKAMEGLLEEAEEVLDSKDEGPLVDARLVASAQRVEHYEISAYGTARTFAERLGYEDVAQLLQNTLYEEGKADERLSDICESEILPESSGPGFLEFLRSERGRVGYLVLYLLGAPVGLLLLLWVIFGNNLLTAG